MLRAATYIAMDVTLRGRGGHPGKSLDGTASAIEIFHRAQYPAGALEGDTTRVSIGRIESGTARNAIPASCAAEGEVRTLLEGEERVDLLATIERAFTEAADALGGMAAVAFDPHCDSYSIDPDEPLLRAWVATLEARGEQLRTTTTFIGSDASALRAHACLHRLHRRTKKEHTYDEYIAIGPLLCRSGGRTAIEVLAKLSSRTSRIFNYARMNSLLAY